MELTRERKIEQARMNAPGVAMEFEDLILPRDKFGPLRYFFVARPRFTLLLVLTLTIIGIGSIWFKRNLTEPGPLHALLGVFIGCIIAAIFLLPVAAANIDTYDIRADTRNSLSILAEVVKFRPGLDDNKWDLIAARLNRIFHHNNNNTTPYFFYDGADCHSYFKQWYIIPGTCKIGVANSSETANFLRPIIDKALKIYTDSVEEYWGRYTAEINHIFAQNNVRNDSHKDQTAS